MRAVSIFLFLTLVLGNTLTFAQDSKMILEQEPRTDFSVYGWTFLLLSLGTLAYGAKVHDDSQENMDKADVNFANYKAATTAADATAFRNAAFDNLNDARAKESRANLALWVGILFGFTSWYSFTAEGPPESMLAFTPDSIIIRHRF